jgi:hypothetical protein
MLGSPSGGYIVRQFNADIMQNRGNLNMSPSKNVLIQDAKRDGPVPTALSGMNRFVSIDRPVLKNPLLLQNSDRVNVLQS